MGFALLQACSEPVRAQLDRSPSYRHHNAHVRTPFTVCDSQDVDPQGGAREISGWRKPCRESKLQAAPAAGNSLTPVRSNGSTWSRRGTIQQWDFSPFTSRQDGAGRRLHLWDFVNFKSSECFALPFESSGTDVCIDSASPSAPFKQPNTHLYSRWFCKVNSLIDEDNRTIVTQPWTRMPCMV